MYGTFLNGVSDKSEPMKNELDMYISRRVIGNHELMMDGLNIQKLRIEAEKKKQEASKKKSMSMGVPKKKKGSNSSVVSYTSRGTSQMVFGTYAKKKPTHCINH